MFAWSLFAIIALSALFSLVQELSDRPAGDNVLKIADDIVWNLFVVEFVFLSALIVTRQRRNAIGWLLMLPALALFLEFYAKSVLELFPTPPAEPTIPLLLAAWLSNWLWLLLIFPLFYTMLLFPDGRMLSPRWRWVIWGGLGMMAFFLLFASLQPTIQLLEDDSAVWQLDNPIGILPAGTEFPDTAWFVGLILLTLFCAAAPFIRYRRSVGMERQQIKWLFYACGFFALVYVVGVFVDQDQDTILNNAWSLLFGLALMGVPAGIGIAILRYRLYDIDVIIRKTLVYTVLTASLAIVYFGSVVLLQSLFETITGETSPVVIVISTLLIAALFSPVRRRVQAVIDRRFYRQKVNAQLVLARFAQSARDEVELEALTADLMQVVRETMQPERAGLWIRDGNQ